MLVASTFVDVCSFISVALVHGERPQKRFLEGQKGRRQWIGHGARFDATALSQ